MTITTGKKRKQTNWMGDIVVSFMLLIGIFYFVRWLIMGGVS